MVGTMGLACDRDGYDLRIPQCCQCGSRGCPKRDVCKTTSEPMFAPGWLQRQLDKTSPPNRLKGVTINEDGDAT